MFMLVVVYKGFKENIKRSPYKIKIICIFIFTTIYIRYIILITFFGIQNIKYLYLFKWGYFLNFIAIPLTALVCIYIAMRNYKVKFAIIFPIGAILLAIYVYIITKYLVVIRVDTVFGYYMKFENISYAYVVYMLLNVIFIVVTLNIYKRGLDRKNIILIICASLMCIVETLMFLIGRGIFIELILGDMLWILTLNYSISKLRKTGR